METINELKEMDGQEVWTNAFGDRFGERVCVGVTYPNCVNAGQVFKPTKKEIKQLWEDMMEQEFGSKEQRAKDLEEEFGHLKTKEDIDKEFGGAE